MSENTQPSTYTCNSHARPHVAIAAFQSVSRGTKRGGVRASKGGVNTPGGVVSYTGGGVDRALLVEA